jgi:hypothetical protein
LLLKLTPNIGQEAAAAADAAINMHMCKFVLPAGRARTVHVIVGCTAEAEEAAVAGYKNAVMHQQQCYTTTICTAAAAAGLTTQLTASCTRPVPAQAGCLPASLLCRSILAKVLLLRNSSNAAHHAADIYNNM